MTRKINSTHTVALLATGDEVVHGDISNTNSQEIAKRLFDNGIHVGMHMVALDQLEEIESAILFLLKTHRALIITGGLGPTSDDLTRYALSNVVKKKLIFDDATWQNIINRLQYFGYKTPPESNRQQALFPENSTIIPNVNGTAAACMVDYNDQLIFMLPGPPPECLPIVNSVILPTLLKNHYQQISYYQKWFLFGISEAQIAEEVDKLAEPFDCQTGYRFCYPYIEIKIHSNNQHDFATLLPLLEKIIAPYIIADGKEIASNLLKNLIPKTKFKLNIIDEATGGLLESVIKTPDTYAYFTKSTNNALQITINGLEEFWQNKQTAQTSLDIIFTHGTHQHQIKKEIPYRSLRVKQYAVEFICREIYTFLMKDYH